MVKQNLTSFFIHLNSISPEIKFTMEVEENMRIPFLDVLIIRKEDGSLGHKVFRKSTHTENYLHADSHHHPSQKFGVLNTLAITTLRISHSDHLDEEKKHLVSVFKSIGYKEKEIRMAIKSVERPTSGWEGVSTLYSRCNRQDCKDPKKERHNHLVLIPQNY